ncbi:MAG: alpha-amylase family glycosyl hydrolase [Chitinophagales bacterium]
MKPIFILTALLLGGNGIRAQFPVIPQMENVAIPLQLNYDTTTIYLSDYFIHPEKIDSVQFTKGLDWKQNADHTIFLKSVTAAKPMYEMKLWCGGFPYSILLKAPQQREVIFSVTDKNYKQVQLAGEMNGWNPKGNSLKFENGKWQTRLLLNPGTYAYQLITDGKWHTDPENSDSASNGNGGFNSVKTVLANNNMPKLRLVSYSDTGIIIACKFPRYPFSLAFYWQNFRLGKRFINMHVAGELADKNATDETRIEIKIPAEAARFRRSFMRVYAYDDQSVGNDLLVPLEDGKVLHETKQIKRTDKHADAIYFVLVDRFCNGDSSNDRKVIHPEIKEKANYCGGDLAGISKQIQNGYFSNLGFNSLWISPIVENPEKAYQEFPEPHDWYSGYHGYWPVSLTRIDHRFGNEPVLHALIDSAHKRNINVFLDLVANHVHEDYFLIKKHPEWRSRFLLADGRKNLRLWDEERLTTWFDNFLPTLDFSNKQVVQLEVDSSVFWLQRYHIDGFRHDATKHIPTTFWRSLTAAIKEKIELPAHTSVFQLGETYGSKELIGSYIGSGMMDGQFDFNLYFTARDVFSGKEEPVEKLAAQLQQSLNYYGSHHLMGNISGNHDLPRFASLAGGALASSEDPRLAGWKRDVGVGDPIAYKKMTLLLTFIATIPGIPVLYYGDEIAMPGAGDPDNRRMMRFENLNENERKLRETVAQIFALRRSHLALIYGDFELLKSSNGLLVYKRSYFDDEVIVAINNSNTDAFISGSLPAGFHPVFGGATAIAAKSMAVFTK